ncbi:MAG: hypothetical protein JWO05_903 [Gemmatimonadetes bacterium]|nr:hypothetical protein [Gemmatimonadota bacterium]
MTELSNARLWVLRATYLLIAVGLGVTIWPGIINAPPNLDLQRGTIRALLGGITIMALIGVRHPVKMLPLLLFELVWKTLWVVAFGLALRSGGQWDDAARESMKACLMGVILMPLVIPWRYVWSEFVTLTVPATMRHSPDSRAQTRV